MKPACDYDLIAIDLDGTLLDSKSRVPPRNIDALHKAHEAGLKVVLCTGRSFTETRAVVHEIGLDLDATVTVGGALLSEAVSGRTIECTCIDDTLAHEAAAWLRLREYAVIWLHDAHTAGDDGFVIDGPRRHAGVDLWLAKTACRMSAVPAPRRGPHAALRLTVLDADDALLELSAAFEAEFAGRLVHNVIHVPKYNFTVLETFAASVSKWTGIERLCRRWKVDPRRTVAIGDDVNDVAMLLSAGLGVAVGNAKPAARQAASRMVASNDLGGVADVIDSILPR